MIDNPTTDILTAAPDYIRRVALSLPMNWESGGKIHNWQNYIGERTRRLWPTFTDETKVALAWDADELADREDWE